MRSTTTVRLVLITAVLTTGLATPAAATACTWRASEVPVPAGADPAEFRITGSDGSGNYSGVARPMSATTVFYRWRNGTPIAQPAPPTGVRAVLDENTAGTVLLEGSAAEVVTQTRDGQYRVLTPPSAYRFVTPVAINNRGEVLAQANRTDGNRTLGLLWRASGVVEVDAPGTSGVYPKDLDEDGTVLLQTTNTAEFAALAWRDGDIMRNGLRTRLSPRAISGGQAVGADLSGSVAPAGWQWDVERGNVTYLSRSTWAEAINSSGLVGGQADRADGPPAVWRGAAFEALLPLLPGMPNARVNSVGEDGVVWGNGRRPIRWQCA